MSPRAVRSRPPVEPAGQVEPAAPVQSPPPAEPAAPKGAVRPAVRFRISRFKQGDRKRHFDAFKVDVEPGATLLDALLLIRRRHDPSLAVRHSCMHASCGTCGVRVNGREMLACDTRLAALPRWRSIKVEPLAGQRVVSDLATDMVDFYARFAAAGMPQLRAAEAGDDAATPEGGRSLGRFENCIECGLCLSACPISRTDRSFLGPAALAAAARVVEEPRGAELGPVLALAAEPDSVWRCHDAMECSVVCPSAVDPATAIIRLRRQVAVSGLRRLFGRSRQGQ